MLGALAAPAAMPLMPCHPRTSTCARVQPYWKTPRCWSRHEAVAPQGVWRTLQVQQAMCSALRPTGFWPGRLQAPASKKERDQDSNPNHSVKSKSKHGLTLGARNRQGFNGGVGLGANKPLVCIALVFRAQFSEGVSS